MTFSVDGLVYALQASFEQGGFNDLSEFVFTRRRDVRRWIIASDFNVGGTAAANDVYAFACYPIAQQGYQHLVDRLVRTIPADFKRTRFISRPLRSFFGEDECFCFVFLLPSNRTAFNKHEQHFLNLQDARILVNEAVQASSADQRIPEYHKSAIRRIQIETQKKQFSLNLFERILILSVLTAFVSRTVAISSAAEMLGWFPDRDNMTTYAGCAWSGFAHLNFEYLWRHTIKNRPSPPIGIVDHRVRGMNEFFDPLIRVPDFLAATFSRWNLDKRTVSIPHGTSSSGKLRYKLIMRNWAADNASLWIGRIRRDEEGYYRCSRIAATVSKKRHMRTIGTHSSR